MISKINFFRVLMREFSCPNCVLLSVLLFYKIGGNLNLKLTSDYYCSEKRLGNNLFRIFPITLFSLWWSTVSNVSAIVLSVTLNGNNPVVVETGNNITMQWSINKTAEFEISINAYFQSQTIKKTKIVYWGNKEPRVLTDGEKNYSGRLETHWVDSKFTLKISNAKYSDSGNYSVRVLLSKERLSRLVFGFATVNVHGMFFQLLSIIVERKLSESNSSHENKFWLYIVRSPSFGQLFFEHKVCAAKENFVFETQKA